MMNTQDSQPMAPTRPVDAIILAAGEGTRMGENGDAPRPKVVYEVAREPMIRWVVRACLAASVRRCIVVIGFEGQQVRDALRDPGGCLFVEQDRRLGTGHATQMAQPLFEGATGATGAAGAEDCDVFVLAGDGPLIRPRTLETLLETHRRHHASATLATAVLDDPGGYGRVIRDANHQFDRIVEQKDASEAELRVQEVNPSYYCFDARKLFEGLGRVRNDNAQHEYYLTDVPGLLKHDGDTVMVVDAVPPEDVLSINTPEQLRQVDRLLRARLESPARQVASAAGRRPA